MLYNFFIILKIVQIKNKNIQYQYQGFQNLKCLIYLHANSCKITSQIIILCLYIALPYNICKWVHFNENNIKLIDIQS